jgi:hypothetical protein
MPRAPWQVLRWKFQPRDDSNGTFGDPIEMTGIKRISGTKGSAQRVDVTALSDSVRKHLAGLPEKGEITLEFVSQSPGLPNPGVNRGQGGKCKLEYVPPTGAPSTLLEFDCLVTGVDVNVGVGDAPTVTVKFAKVRFV